MQDACLFCLFLTKKPLLLRMKGQFWKHTSHLSLAPLFPVLFPCRTQVRKLLLHQGRKKLPGGREASPFDLGPPLFPFPASSTTPTSAHRLQVEHAVLGFLQQRYKLGGEEPQALLVPAAAIAAVAAAAAGTPAAVQAAAAARNHLGQRCRGHAASLQPPRPVGFPRQRRPHVALADCLLSSPAASEHSWP